MAIKINAVVECDNMPCKSKTEATLILSGDSLLIDSFQDAEWKQVSRQSNETTADPWHKDEFEYFQFCPKPQCQTILKLYGYPND